MKNIILLVFIISAYSLLTGCAANGALFSTQASPSKGNSLVYIYRPYNKYAQNGGPKILIDGKEIGVLLNNGYTFVYLAPGEHEITAKGNMWNWAFPLQSLKLNTAEGSTNYVRLFPDHTGTNYSSNGISVGFSQDFRVVSSEQAVAEIVNCKKIK